MEKAHYREMLLFLKEQGCPMMSTRVQASKILGICQQNLRREIAKGRIKICEDKIPIGSLASYLCG